MAMDGRYAGNAGAISGSPWIAGMPKMQEHFSAGAWMARHLETKEHSMAGMPRRRELFPAVRIRLPARLIMGYARRSQR
jgi:hypothetical protein